MFFDCGSELDNLTRAVGNMIGYSNEIDHLLQRVGLIDTPLQKLRTSDCSG